MPMPGAKILIVDDEPGVIQVLSLYLRRLGHALSAAGSAEEAVGLAKTGDFDLILLDNQLPGISGMGAIAEFGKHTPAPIILMTGHADQETAKDALLLGAKAVLAKPMDLEQLGSLIESLLKR